jgi:hypothetical protein
MALYGMRGCLTKTNLPQKLSERKSFLFTSRRGAVIVSAPAEASAAGGSIKYIYETAYYDSHHAPRRFGAAGRLAATAAQALEAGVGRWFAPFTLGYDFTYAGTGKKGGY